MATNTVSYFQSSLLAQEMEDTWTGTVRFNSNQALTESEKAQARENIGAVPFGSNLKILGHFDTVTDLQASAPKNVGDAYSVGTTTPYNLYIFDGLRNEWMDYGQIRATDISAQYVENQSIAVTGWTQDETVFADYHYKAQITISGASSDDFPIISFEPKDATSGNFCPTAFAFDGYIEIWAKSIPAAAINIPVATIIVNGGNGRGITNASPGVEAGTVSKQYTATIDADAWTGSAAPYSNTVTVTGLLATDNPIVDIMPSETYATAEKEIEDYAAIYRMVTANNLLTVYATEKPSVDINIQIKAVRK